jgi:hypothetical protein
VGRLSGWIKVVATEGVQSIVNVLKAQQSSDSRNRSESTLRPDTVEKVGI